jgi:NADH dehydrogenase
MPILPLFGTGAVKLQPVYVGDVAEAVARALATEAATGKIYELGGPRAYTYKALLQLLLQQLGRRRLLMPVPYFAGKSWLPSWRPCRIARSPATRSC